MTCYIAIKIFRSESKKLLDNRRKHFSEGKGTISLDIAKSKKCCIRFFTKFARFSVFASSLFVIIFSQGNHNRSFSYSSVGLSSADCVALALYLKSWCIQSSFLSNIAARTTLIHPRNNPTKKSVLWGSFVKLPF